MHSEFHRVDFNALQIQSQSNQKTILITRLCVSVKPLHVGTQHKQTPMLIDDHGNPLLFFLLSEKEAKLNFKFRK